MDLFTYHRKLQVHCSLFNVLLFAGVAAAAEEQEEIRLPPDRLILSVLYACQSTALRPQGSILSPQFLSCLPEGW